MPHVGPSNAKFLGSDPGEPKAVIGNLSILSHHCVDLLPKFVTSGQPYGDCLDRFGRVAQPHGYVAAVTSSIWQKAVSDIIVARGVCQ